jgi:hypothetical protein
MGKSAAPNGRSPRPSKALGRNEPQLEDYAAAALDEANADSTLKSELEH